MRRCARACAHLGVRLPARQRLTVVVWPGGQPVFLDLDNAAARPADQAPIATATPSMENAGHLDTWTLRARC